MRAGLDCGTALKVAPAADTVSIAGMEILDNAVTLAVPSAMGSRPRQPGVLGVAGIRPGNGRSG
ncbi:hypothetical protein QLQ12_34650 [Actinoplanes sp. NEAU-A12]|uniref:DUF4396 domain-containing protein n=1 Tax=Actinoplanes sandaracinus TaxID=3045177 RepID=A0ABT6WVK1_9ACTN|nr:DUF4396 domain-containing protein [Actinoplanes sandaracinus]MDI6103767.1 hypothetical protein [Actinoplanes sandaracinus]